MDKTTIIKTLRDMAKHPTVTLPRDTDALKAAADLLEQAQKQEPVAWVCHGMHDHNDIDFLEEDIDSLPVGTNLYTTPPQRQPLTDEQILAAALGHYNPYQRAEISFARAIEAAHGIKGEA